MKDLGYYNGKFGPIAEMTVPMNDRVCYFGDGIYEATCVRNHSIFLLDEHVDRFYRSAEGVKIDIPYTKDELKAILREMVAKVDSPDQTCYWQVTRGTAPRKHCFPGKDVKANLWITLTPANRRDTKKPMAITETEDLRFFLCNVKTLNLLLNVLANEKAHSSGCEECVFHRGDRVTEGSHSNISIIKNGVLQTAPLDNLILPGIARHHLLMAAEKCGIPTLEKPFTLEELANADEVIVTSSTLFAVRANEFCGKPVGGKAPELFEELRSKVIAEFEAYTGEGK